MESLLPRFVEMFSRDRERFEQSLGPRRRVAAWDPELWRVRTFRSTAKPSQRNWALPRVSANSLDATCDRDFVLEFLSNAAITHGACEPVWPKTGLFILTEEFGFLELSKKSQPAAASCRRRRIPDGLELIRAKAAMTAGLLSGFLSVMKGLPTGYNKDLQEDKEAFLKAFENVRLCLSVLRLSVRTVRLRTEKTQKAAADSFMGATDLADFLVMKGRAVQTAHEIVGRAVREALKSTKSSTKWISKASPFSQLPCGPSVRPQTSELR